MKKATLLIQSIAFFAIFMFIMPSEMQAQIATPPAAGDGSEENPYQIATLENLYWLSQSQSKWDKHYIQTADIDASVSENWDAGAGFTPIGNEFQPFKGTYNGQFHTIDNIYINRPYKSSVGLFGFVHSHVFPVKNSHVTHIKKLGVTNAIIEGNKYVGILVGRLSFGRVSSCYSSGSVHARSQTAGGLIGHNYGGIIILSYSKANTSSNGNYVGGFIGYINEGDISNCYSRGTASGYYYIGGFAGKGKNTLIRRSYSTGKVNYNTSSSRYGGFIATTENTIVPGCFYDKQTAGVTYSYAGVGLTTQEMKTITTFINAGWSNSIWDIGDNFNNGYPYLACIGQVDIIGSYSTEINANSAAVSTQISIINAVVSNHGICWSEESNPTVNDNHTTQGDINESGVFNSLLTNLESNTKYYVRAYINHNGNIIYGDELELFTSPEMEKPQGKGTISDPYQIKTLANLCWVSQHSKEWNKHYIQKADINASATRYWDEGRGFSSIGNVYNSFSGTYNGNEFTINGLYIDRPKTENIGLFGFIYGREAKVEKIGVKNARISGGNHTGVLVGYNNGGTLKNSFVSGTIYSKSDAIGGFAGYNLGPINNCYADVDVNGRSKIGGFIGNNMRTSVRYCYSIGNVRGVEETGGFIGKNHSGRILSCFFDMRASGQTTSDGGRGLNTLYANVNKILIKSGWDYIKEVGNGTNDYWMPNEKRPMYFPLLEWQGIGNSLGGLEYRTISKAKTENDIQNIELTTYPNPFSDYLNIKSSRIIKAVRILDMKGSVKLNTTKKSNINTSNLQSGVYILLIEDEEGKIYQEKIIRR